MATAFLRLLVILLAFSHLICSNAVPVTRIGGLKPHSIRPQVQEEHNKGMKQNGRMDVELNDYPGSGANNRHTPKPQYGRCADC